MGFSSTNVSDKLILVAVVASMLVTVSVANRDWYYGGGGGFNYTTHWPWGPRNDSYNLNYTNNGPNKIIVGGSEHWHYGFNYSVWAFHNASFYVNDVLVFKYDPPSSQMPFAHSVYLLPNMRSYLNCDLSRAKLIANTTQGGGKGFEFVLKRWKPYYFACAEHDGIHCRDGGMKFFVMPMLRRWHY
ncbi:hypothetical protein ACOSP7_005357 [Xanthoceras sorbifolium]|uniref:Phytocyanin domain-containing protein n=1 Tax=Xanthoceras sorbifolium TaxID=99658 RepID=A0ABQ8IET3_9ROSI|nr:hypothetical protein JRO89_XS02G0061100 [Xanthoceras sorbifolium]